MMTRAASKTMTGNEELNAQSDWVFTLGTIIALDLDRFSEYVEEKGLDPYRPNIVTGELTNLVEEFARRHRGVVVYGLSKERGTEEAIIEIPFSTDVEGVVRDLEELKRRIESYGVSITIVVLVDYVTGRSAKNRREAYHGTPARRRAIRLLREIKRKGGGRILVVA
jgi:hypothetical protein